MIRIILHGFRGQSFLISQRKKVQNCVQQIFCEGSGVIERGMVF